MAVPGFYDDPKSSGKIAGERSRAAHAVERDRHYREVFEELETLIELLDEGEPVEEQLHAVLERVQSELDADEIEMLLSGPHDEAGAIVTVHPGMGGIDAQDWAEMLVRMYLKWCERHGFQAVIVERQAGEEAGIKSATIRVTGQHAYGHLRTETGVHRLVRISPFDQQGRRQTAFASLHVFPDIAEEIEIEIDPKDLRVDTFRSSGAGGQHVNVTDSAIRITHLPTGIVTSCQNERSQHSNRDVAMRVLKAKLYELELEKQRHEIETASGEKKKIDFGSQIRSYFMHPTQRVKDHRTGLEIGSIQAVLDGGIDPFIQAYLTRPKGAPPPDAGSGD
jgi:peptide chain release factor 2